MSFRKWQISLFHSPNEFLSRLVTTAALFCRQVPSNKKSPPRWRKGRQKIVTAIVTRIAFLSQHQQQHQQQHQPLVWNTWQSKQRLAFIQNTQMSIKKPTWLPRLRKKQRCGEAAIKFFICWFIWSIKPVVKTRNEIKRVNLGKKTPVC